MIKIYFNYQKHTITYKFIFMFSKFLIGKTINKTIKNNFKSKRKNKKKMKRVQKKTKNRYSLATDPNNDQIIVPISAEEPVKTYDELPPSNRPVYKE